MPARQGRAGAQKTGIKSDVIFAAGCAHKKAGLPVTFGHLPEVSITSVVRVSMFPTCHENDEYLLPYELVHSKLRFVKSSPGSVHVAML